MRIVTYNPLGASFERHEDISHELKSWDIILLSGTQRVAQLDHPVQEHMHAYHWGVHFGRRMGLMKKLVTAS
eukprot:8413074-Pyramimonas_sp.AAC.1